MTVPQIEKDYLGLYMSTAMLKICNTGLYCEYFKGRKFFGRFIIFFRNENVHLDICKIELITKY